MQPSRNRKGGNGNPPPHRWRVRALSQPTNPHAPNRPWPLCETRVVITERDLPPGDWKDALSALQQLPRQPLLIVTSRLADEELWSEVLNLGAHNVLAKPFRAVEVQWVLESAWRICASRGNRLLNTSEVATDSGAA